MDVDTRYETLVGLAIQARELHADQLAAQSAEVAADKALADAQRARDAALTLLDEDARKKAVAEMSQELVLAIGRFDWAEVARLSAAIVAATAERDAAAAAYAAAQTAVEQATSAQAAARQAVRDKAETRRVVLGQLEKLAHELV